MLTGERIVCISAIDWDFVWQSQQEIMRRLAAAGNDVLYVENLGTRSPGLRDAGRVLRRAAKWLRGGRTARVAERGVRVHSPVLLPFPYSGIARAVNRRILARSVVPLATAGGSRPIVWTFLPTPTALDLARMLHPKLLVFHRMDDLSASSPAAAALVPTERRLIAEADVVFATSRRLQEGARAQRADVHHMPPGVNFDAFASAPAAEPSDLADIPRPRAVYVGGIHRWLDVELMDEVARLVPDVQIVFVGPLQIPRFEVHSGNVRSLGRRPHGELAGYLHAADALVIPYRQSRYVDSVYPNKLSEYLATGLPVVATPIPELVRFEREQPGTIRFGAGAAAFAAALREALTESDPALSQRRVAAARDNDWGRRLEAMSAVIERALARKAHAS